MKRYIPKFKKGPNSPIRMKFFQLFFAGFAAVFAVILLFNNDTLGWFSHITEVTGENMRVELQYIDLDAEFWVYRYDIFSNQVITGREITDVHLQPHDLIFTKRNRYTPLVVRARLSGKALNNNDLIHFSVSRDTHTAEPGPGSSSQLPVLSSQVLRFTGAIGEALGSSAGESTQGMEIYKNLDKALYESVLGYSGNKTVSETTDPASPQCVVGSSNVFVTANAHASDIDVQIPYDPKTDLKSGPDGKRSLEVYLYISYDETLIGALHKASGAMADGDNYTLRMSNDLDYVTISATSTTK